MGITSSQLVVFNLWKLIPLGVDTSIAPHSPIFEDIPPSDVEILENKNAELKSRVEAMQSALDEIIMGGM